MPISFITKYKCIMKDCIFHFILSGPEIYIRKCSLAASAWSLCKIIVNQFFVFQFRSFEFRYHPCTTPPSVDHFIQITIQNAIQFMKCQLDSMICYSSLWKIISSDLLRTISCTNLTSSLCCLRSLFLLKLQVIQFGTKQSECLLFILQL